jgi:hypothetical protein
MGADSWCRVDLAYESAKEIVKSESAASVQGVVHRIYYASDSDVGHGTRTTPLRGITARAWTRVAIERDIHQAEDFINSHRSIIIAISCARKRRALNRLTLATVSAWHSTSTRL